MRNLNPIRRTVQRLLLSLWSGCVVLAAQATTYYVAETGNDANSGNTQAGGRTVHRVNRDAYTMQPGDQVLFKEVSGAALIIGSSGTTSSPTMWAPTVAVRPRPAGSTALTGWTVHRQHLEGTRPHREVPSAAASS